MDQKPFYWTDQQNREVRIEFDQGNRFYLGSGFIFNRNQDNKASDTFGFMEFHYDQRWNTKKELNDFWKMNTHFLHFQGSPNEKNQDGIPEFHGSLFEGEFIKYNPTTMITIGSTRLEVPFLFGFKVETGQIEIQKEVPRYEFGIIDSRLLLDFWRSSELRNKILLGIGIHYDIIYHKETLDHQTEHQIAPFSAVSLKLHHESRNNLRIFDILADFIPIWSNINGWGYNYLVKLSFEWIFLSINDQPLSIKTELAYIHKGLWESQKDEIKALISLGLSFQTTP